ncbi:hypothetical protein [Caryophanon tenue]|uniref:Uncharacterized protein n=1 Tax=Caryophanon tenue TaxID=33978 RepID=A0A1C0YHT3_9BACL|nr:hypothetical protein [Caryophanon tenue]OCS86679.1 hypothetical protein A6M13_12770 [Caryophanon tenue]
MQANIPLIVSGQRALFLALSKNTKAVYANIENQTLIWTVYFDEVPTEEEIDRLSIAATEIIADFPEVRHCEEQYITHPSTLHVQHEPYYHWLYARL